MSKVQSSAEHLTLNADGAGNDIKFQSNATEVAVIDQAGNLTLSGTVDGVDIQTLNTAVTANTAKTGITSGQAGEITANTAKTGITSGQATAITANTAKVTNYNQTKADIDALGIAASSITGALPAISGANLTGIDAATVSTTAPSSPSAGDLWFDSTSGTTAMKVYSGTGWDQMSNKFTASGGTVTTSGSYKYHTFTSSGTFTAESSGTVDVLIIAAGAGGGGGYQSGGGGAGGVVYTASKSITSGNYSVTVGAGGAGHVPSTSIATNGGNSSVSGLSLTTAVGGGRPACQDTSFGGTNSGLSGGSGGGGSHDGGLSGYAGTSGQGNSGGDGYNPAPHGGGGGGGAGAAGENSPSNRGGHGGAGTNTYSAWATATSSGDSGYFAGGGAGTNRGSTSSSGGAGGGGDYGATQGGSGQTNTGGGGAGGRGANYGGSNAGRGGSGGSGIVIIRYAV